MTGQILDNSSSVQWLAFCLAQAFDSRKENFAVESGHEPRSKGIKTESWRILHQHQPSGHEPRSKGIKTSETRFILLARLAHIDCIVGIRE